MISDGTASEEERLGALGDLQLALRRLDRGGDVLVAATDKQLAEPLRFARERAAPVTLCVRMPDRRRLAGRHGCVLLDAAGRIVDFEEKPERPKSNIASLAVYVLTPAAQDLLGDYLRGGGNRDAPGHFLSWLTRATTVYGYVTDGRRLRRRHARVLRRGAARVSDDARSLTRLTAAPANRGRRPRKRQRQPRQEFLKQVAQASGIETPTREDLAKVDKDRPKKGSNDEWKHPHDEDARITKMQDGRTHLAIVPELGARRGAGASG